MFLVNVLLSDQRASIIERFSWTILDGGLALTSPQESSASTQVQDTLLTTELTTMISEDQFNDLLVGVRGFFVIPVKLVIVVIVGGGLGFVTASIVNKRRKNKYSSHINENNQKNLG